MSGNRFWLAILELGYFKGLPRRYVIDIITNSALELDLSILL